MIFFDRRFGSGLICGKNTMKISAADLAREMFLL